MKGYKNKNDGFTLVETLIAVAIMVILLALSILGIVRYRNYLKITELDNMAREIYMAAQNRAVLLHNSGRLQAELDKAGKQPLQAEDLPSGITEGTCYITWTGTAGEGWDELLPVGTIDPTLRDGKFYIIYEPASGSVTDVFFVEDITYDFPNELPIEEAFDLAYKGKDDRMKNDPMLGWHHGDPMDLVGMKPLPAPGVEVIIENGNELTLTVRYTMPVLPDGLTVNRIPRVRLEYGGQTVEFPVTTTGTATATGRVSTIKLPTSGNNIDNITEGETISYTWVLDSLEQDASNAYTKQFMGLFGSGDLVFGDDFTVTAGLKLEAEGYIDSAYYPQTTDNSLFAKGTNYSDSENNEKTYTDASGNIVKVPANTALIENLRHLQNLHRAYSVAGSGIQKAEQLCDIDCEASKKNNGDILNPEYNFIPIVNDSLKCYDGRQKNITNLYASWNGDVGLFGTIKGIDSERATVQGVRLVNATVNSTGGNSAGALAANAEKCDFTDCRVYWEKSKDGKTATDLLTKISGSKNEIDYKVSGKNAGGLIGSASGNVNIQNSFAATTVKGTGNAADACIGGLVGTVTGGGTSTVVNIDSSYADCYLKAEGTADNIGGLVGFGAAKLTNCYAAGFIIDPADAVTTAGLVNGTLNPGTSNVYSVVRVLNTTDNSLAKPQKPLNGNMGDGSGSVLYISKEADVTNVITALGSAFENDDAEPETYIYDLRFKLSNKNEDKLQGKYPYPGLNSLPHYCDWADLDDISIGLVYYEHYSNDNSYGIHGRNENGSISAGMKEDIANPVVTKDGYALAFDSLPASDYQIVYGNSPVQIWTLKKSETEGKWAWYLVNVLKQDGVEAITDVAGYNLIPLPDDIVTGRLPGMSAMTGTNFKFYQKLVCGEDADAMTYYFNPHFAKSVAAGPTKKEDETVTQPEQPDDPTAEVAPAYVRTARHLWHLSEMHVIGTNNAALRFYPSMGLYYQQELDVDYGTYEEGYDGIFKPGAQPFEQVPIGSGGGFINGTVFTGTYDGGCHIIRNVLFNQNKSLRCIGLFGASEGILKNIVYQMELESEKAPEIKAYNDTSHTKYTKEAAGMLVGYNYGTVQNCAVFGAKVRVTLSNSTSEDDVINYCGGLVGVNEGIITNCAAEIVCLQAEAKGAISGKSNTVYVGGLVGLNNSSGTVTSSYAVGKIAMVSGQTGTIAGLVAKNDGSVNTSYAGVNLDSSGTDAAVTTYGLCGGNAADDASGWLKDAFVYRGEKYNTAAINNYQDSGKGISFDTLKANLLGTMPMVTDNTVKNFPAGKTKETGYGGSYKGGFPYLSGVKGLKRNEDGTINPTSNSSDNSIHYGLWPTPLPVGLAYYEQYSWVYKNADSEFDASNYGVLGSYEGKSIDTKLADDKVIKYTPNENGTYGGMYSSECIWKDGYAVVFDVSDGMVPDGDYEFEYGTTDTNTQTWTLEKNTATNGAITWKWMLEKNTNENGDVTYEMLQEVESVNVEKTIENKTNPVYIVIPLPDKVNTEYLADNTVFYQKLVYGKDFFGERTFYFNPHFAKTVNAGTVVDGTYHPPDVPAAPTNMKGEGVSIRTPRHFYSLSRFQESSGSLIYNQAGYYIQQELDLDYNTYYDKCSSYGAAGFRPSYNNVTGKPAEGCDDHYYKQPSITIEHPDACNGSFIGTYDGGNHTIRNVFYEIPDKPLQYLGLFKQASPKNLTYEVPDNIEVNLTNSVDGTYVDGYQDGIKVGTLLGGSGYDLTNCTVKMNNLTVTSSNAKIYVGGMTGYINYANDPNNRVEITGKLRVECTSADESDEMNVAAGGMVGVILRSLDNCTGIVNSIEVKGNQYCYAGGLVGRTAANSNSPHPTIDSLKFDPRRIKNCSVEVGTLSVEGTGYVYGGGLAGWSDRIYNCNAVVTGSLTATGSQSLVVNAGGLAGGACDVQDCSAVAATVKANGLYSYAGGLLGVVKMTYLTKQKPLDNYPQNLQVKNSYAAVAKVEGGENADAFCGHWVNNTGDNSVPGPEVEVSFSNNYYLDGDAESWHIGDTNNTKADTNISDDVTGKSYDELKDLAGTLGTEWGTITPAEGSTDPVYPFPVSTTKNGNWYYPGTDWPKKLSTTTFGLRSEENDIEIGLVHYDITASGEYIINSPGEEGHETCEGESGYALRFRNDEAWLWSAIRIKCNDSEDEYVLKKESTEKFTVQSCPEDIFIRLSGETVSFEDNPKITITIESTWLTYPGSEQTWEQTLTRWINSADHTVSETEIIPASEPETGDETASETETDHEPVTEMRPEITAVVPGEDDGKQSGEGEDDDEQSNEDEDQLP